MEGEEGDGEDDPGVLVNVARPHPQDSLWRRLGWFILNINNSWVLMLVKDSNNLTSTTLEKRLGELTSSIEEGKKKGRNALWGRRCTAFYVENS